MVSNYSKSLLYFQLISITLLCFTITQNLYSQFTIVTIASDDANTNYGGGFGDGSNGGSGFEAWSITYGSSTGTFTGSPGSDGMNTATIGSNAWAFYSTGSEYVNATRRFSQAMAVGDKFTFDWAMNWDANGGTKGFDLMAGSTSVFNVNNGGFSSTITAGGLDANTNYGTADMTVTVSRTSGSKYSFTMTSRSGGSAYTTTISSSAAIDALKIYSGNQNDGSGQRNIYFNNFEITRSSTSATLTGSAGWRLLTSPDTTTYEALLGPIWTQGIPNSDAYDVEDNPAPNVYLWNSTAWGAVPDLNQTISAGSGFLVYVFQDDDYNQSEDPGTWPKTLSLTGFENGDGITPTINTTNDEWSLVGNPYASTIDWDNVNDANTTGTAYVWNPNDGSGAWDVWTGSTGDLTGGLIAPFQAFFIKNASSGTPSITFNNDDKATGGSFLGKLAEAEPSIIRMEIDGPNGISNSSWMEFSDEGSLESTIREAFELQSLAFSSVQFGFQKGDDLMDIVHLPEQGDEYSLPVVINSTESGEFLLSVTDFNLPSNLEVTFHDHRSGISTILEEGIAIRIDLESQAKAKKPRELLATGLTMKGKSSDHQFSISVNTVATTVNVEEGEEPNAFVLSQNYPNPFNPSTTITYSLEQAGLVSLSVYNALGQRVTQLVNKTQSPGSYNVQWDASVAPTGIYYYRLEVDGVSLTKKMTLIK